MVGFPHFGRNAQVSEQSTLHGNGRELIKIDLFRILDHG